jgi:hypothetical protein
VPGLLAAIRLVNASSRERNSALCSACN